MSISTAASSSGTSRVQADVTPSGAASESTRYFLPCQTMPDSAASGRPAKSRLTASSVCTALATYGRPRQAAGAETPRRTEKSSST